MFPKEVLRYEAIDVETTDRTGVSCQRSGVPAGLTDVTFLGRRHNTDIKCPASEVQNERIVLGPVGNNWMPNAVSIVLKHCERLG